jgi:outer membrane receptor protein involved in Fe transport
MPAVTSRSGLLLLRSLLVAGLVGSPTWAADPVPEGEQARSGGGIVGRVFDAETGVSLEGVTVSVSGPASEPGATPPEAVRVTDAEGAFELPSLPPGRYDIRFVKPGYRKSSMTDFVVMAGQPNRADFPLPPLASAAAEAMPDVEEFVVVASPVAEILSASRLDSDQLLNTLSAEDFSKLAVSDVADALKFVPGVNVVEGQFAVIRGLEDRYSSTLFNSAPVPSPDPDRQSVQLDLFPSDVVSDLAVAKTFGPELPSNSSGGSINILTSQYPEEFEFKLGAGTGFNSNAWGDFLQFEDGSAVGNATDGHDTLEQDYAASLGGRGSVSEREIRFKAAVGWETDYATREGFQETLEPALAVTRQFPKPPTVVQSGDLTLGQLGLSGGRFDLTESDYEDQLTGYAGLGIDLDEAGNHKLDSSFFYTEKHGEAVVATDDGYLPGFDYDTLAAKQADGQEINPNTDFECCATLTTWIRSVRGSANEPASRGPLWFSSFSTSESFETDRDLFLSQLNGDHRFDAIEGLHVSWATNYAETTQNETSRGLRYFFEPDDVNQAPTKFPVRPEDLGPGQFATNGGIFLNKNDITEDQGFGRLDADYEVPVTDALDVTFSSGAWYEDASRHVDSSFLESPTVNGLSQLEIFADTPEELGRSVYEEIAPAPEGLRDAKNQSSREIEAWYLGSKSTLYEDFDLLAGFRLENIFIESLNEPFTGELALDGSPAIFPTKYLFFDRLDNPARNEVSTPPPPGTTFNDQLLGIDVPVDPATGLVDLVDQAQIESFVNGRIDETKFLPALGFSYRPIEGLAIRGAWSETVARPSFREMGFYVSVEPATDDLLVGNPQLGLSEVESYDTRAEYVFGDHGDIAALSLFYKTIQDPIESIVVRNPLNFDGSSSALFRTFFNNENEATVQGIEIEARKSLDFFGPELLQYVSLGGSYTYIDAEVDRSEIEIQRAAGFFGKAPGALERFSGLAGSRRLFGQPEWIMNADISFDQPDWGTKATLVLFGISDVLDAAGSSVISPNGSIISFTPDRYIDSFYQLDLILSQKWRVDFLRGDLTLKLSAKNLTDSTRQIIYDKDQTAGTIAERSWKTGRDFKLSLVYSF